MREARMRRQQGFSYIEVLVSIVMLAMVAAALAAGLVAANRQIGASRTDTSATAVAQSMLDDLANTTYANLGLPGGNPDGTIPATKTVTVGKVGYQVDTDIRYADDPAGGQPRLYANYKEVTVTVTPQVPDAVATSLTRTFSPPSAGAVRDKATAVVSVVDSMTSEPVPGVLVRVDGSTSAPRTGLTDNLGQVAFGLLEPSPPSTTDPKYYYNFTATKTGYVTHPGSTPTKLHLAANQSVSPIIKMFRPATIVVNVTDRSTGLPITEFTSVKVTTPDPGSLSETKQGNSSPYTFTQVAGKDIEPRSAPFTVDVTADCYGTLTRTSPVPVGYPSVTTQVFNVAFDPKPHGNLDVQVLDLTGRAIVGAQVQVSGGAQNLAPRSRVTDATGKAHYCLEPSGGVKYVVSATAVGFTSGAALVTVNSGGTTTQQIRLGPIANSCSIVLNAGASGQLVRLTHPTTGYELAQLTNSLGKATFASLPYLSTAPNYLAYVATGTAGDGSPVFSPAAGKAVGCVTGQTREYPIP